MLSLKKLLETQLKILTRNLTTNGDRVQAREIKMDCNIIEGVTGKYIVSKIQRLFETSGELVKNAKKRCTGFVMGNFTV